MEMYRLIHRFHKLTFSSQQFIINKLGILGPTEKYQGMKNGTKHLLRLFNKIQEEDKINMFETLIKVKEKTNDDM